MHFPRGRLDLPTHHRSLFSMALTASLFHNKQSLLMLTSRSPPSLPLCSWCCSYFLFFLCFSSHILTFSVASNLPVPILRTNTTSIPTTPPSPSPSPSPSSHLNTNHPSHSNLVIIIIIVSAISSVLLFLIIIMGVFACFKLQNKRRSKRVENASEDSHFHPPITTDLPDLKIMSDEAPQQFTWNEIERLSSNFSNIVGQGGFSTVYLARFSNSSLAALKLINRNSSERLNRMFKQELDILLNMGSHENIVKLLGYSDEVEKEGCLLFEYVPNGNLHDNLHQLSWHSRMKIAFQLGQAIEYLHDKCSLQIVHGDIKASNVLLDDKLNCKLCDFGFAKMGFSSSVLIRPSSASIMGSPGYMDPHYLRTGIASKKNDVYSFGVVVLELLTGMEAFCSEKEQQLTTVVAPMLKDPNKVAEMVDPVMGEFDAEEVRVMALISAQCLKQQPSLRPSMSDILSTMRERISSLSNIGFGSEEKIQSFQV